MLKINFFSFFMMKISCLAEKRNNNRKALANMLHDKTISSQQKLGYKRSKRVLGQLHSMKIGPKTNPKPNLNPNLNRRAGGGGEGGSVQFSSKRDNFLDTV